MTLSKVAEASASSATSRISVSGLDINTDDFYIVETSIANVDTECHYSIFVNGIFNLDTSVPKTQNYKQLFEDTWSDGTTAGFNEPWADITATKAGVAAVSTSLVFLDTDGYARFTHYGSRDDQTTTNAQMNTLMNYMTSTVTNITDLGVVAWNGGSGEVNQLAAGSEMEVYTE